jgi:hypothetical protein
MPPQARYGLTSADVDAMVEAQGGVCLLCRERPPSTSTTTT